jgi:hypothetical protein
MEGGYYENNKRKMVTGTVRRSEWMEKKEEKR